MNIDEIMVRRSESNERMANKPGSLYEFYQFVRVLKSEDENNDENGENWGRSLAKTFTSIAAKENRYPKVFKFLKNLSSGQETNDLLTADKYILDKDVITLMDTIYPISDYTRQQQAENLTAEFFLKESLKVQ